MNDDNDRRAASDLYTGVQNENLQYRHSVDLVQLLDRTLRCRRAGRILSVPWREGDAVDGPAVG